MLLIRKSNQNINGKKEITFTDKIRPLQTRKTVKTLSSYVKKQVHVEDSERYFITKQTLFSMQQNDYEYFLYYTYRI